MSIILHIYDIDCSYPSKVSEHSSMESLGCHYTSKVEVWFRYIHIQLKIKDRCAVFKSIHTLDIEIKLICCLGN